MLADRAGLSTAYISRLERDQYQNPGNSTLGKIATALDVQIADLLHEPGQRSSSPRTQIEPHRAFVPLIDRMVHAGADTWWQDTGETVEVSSAMAARFGNLLSGLVTGSCMQPHASPGDIVIWDQGSTHWADGEMVVVSLDGNLLIKWAYREPGGGVLLTAPDGTEIRPDGAILEGPVVDIRRRPVRGPRR
jgi:transcriptional regulator with XRE-family HTH domain